MKNPSKHFFAGSNTAEGFYSLFNNIIDINDANRIIYLKGGPGTGKSSLMKSIADFFIKNNYTVDFFHCSSDSNSLDSIKIKELKIAMVDGTAPHMLDPKVPGAIDKIVNLGDLLDENKLKKHKNEIIKISNEISQTFKRAYRYLNAAKAIHEDWSVLNCNAKNHGNLYKLERELKTNLFKENIYNDSIGKKRHLFISAITPEGIVTHTDSIYIDMKNIYVLNGAPGTGKTEILNNISNEALNRGLCVEYYHNPLIPNILEHIVIPEINSAIVTSNEINKQFLDGEQIYMDNLLDLSILNSNRNKINEDKELFYKLINKATDILHSEKSIHDDLEKYYVDNMDFSKIPQIRESIINDFLSFKTD
ncbi:PRK06851 family protein [Clostridium sp. L74]|uniref:PRK06851 family protein n=1 Tax=Clostridium sp. L74 TaxID=1560217 RepID=UPI0006ABE047|nr:PRK06851 family protein [Clostridium sp. L74]EJP6472165.1 PRK06851 family protein [Clostridium botulinum]KOR26231.1 ATPase [Clostridium sp. L74]